MSLKVCMFVYNEVIHDARVLKEAKTLADAGHHVRVIAILSEDTVAYEERDGFKILRSTLDPIHHRFLRLLSFVATRARKLIGLEDKRPLQDYVSTGLEKPAGTESPQRRLATMSTHQGLSWPGRLVYMVTVYLPMAYLSYIEYYRRSFRLARREPANVFHAHDLNTLPVAWLCSRLSKAKLVYDSHELWLDRPRHRSRSKLNRFLVKIIESFLIRRTEANIIAGESSANVLSERYGIVRPTVVLNTPPYFAAERSRVLRDSLNIPEHERIVLYIGRISYHRGLEEEIKSLKYLSQCHLVAMGFGPDHYVYHLKSIIARQGLTDRVHFIEPVPFTEVTRYASSADVGVILSKNIGLSYFYISPNKLFECIVGGLPVVGSNFPDLKRVIEGYRLGVTCDPESPREIAAAIDYILSDSGRYEEMRKNALEAGKVFNWENESKKLVALYERLRDNENR